MTEDLGRAGGLERLVRVGGVDRHWGIAVETPVEITLNGDPWTVLLATPTDLEALAVGLAITEGVVRDPAGIEAVTIAAFLQDIRVDLRVAAWACDEGARRARSLVSGTACGLCGIESLAALQARRPAQHRSPASRTEPAPHDAAILAAHEALHTLQPLNAATHSVHAAAWCASNGHIWFACEDVGRHNALDKLVGTLARSGRLAEPGFILMTSRGSYELVAKAAVTGAVLLATVSAPTSLALSWAAALGLPIVSTCGHGAHRQVVRFPIAEHAHAG